MNEGGIIRRYQPPYMLIPFLIFTKQEQFFFGFFQNLNEKIEIPHQSKSQMQANLNRDGYSNIIKRFDDTNCIIFINLLSCIEHLTGKAFQQILLSSMGEGDSTTKWFHSSNV